MAYMIDGHNLIPHVAGLSLSAPDDEQRLIERLQIFCRKERKQVEVYFDKAAPGQSGEQRFGMVKAYFVQAGITADQAIQRRLARLGRTARNWTVVTSDLAIQAAARERHAQVIDSEQFAARLLNNKITDGLTEKGEDVKLSPDEVDDWLHLFQKKPNK